MIDPEDQFAGLPTGATIGVPRSRREPSGLLLRVTVYVAVLQTLCAFLLDNVSWSIAPALYGLAGLAFWLYVPTAVADAVLCIRSLRTPRTSYRIFAIIALALVVLQVALVVYAVVRFVTGPAPWDF